MPHFICAECEGGTGFYLCERCEHYKARIERETVSRIIEWLRKDLDGPFGKLCTAARALARGEWREQ